MYIKVNEDKRGKDHINIYSDDPQNPDHTSIYINEEIGLGSTQYELVEI